MSSRERQLRHLAQSKPKFREDIPDNDSGRDGDIVYVKRNNITESYIKEDGEWINLFTGTDVQRTAQQGGSRIRMIGGVSTVVPSGGGGNHNLLLNLDDDDHTQYVHNIAPRTITANHTFSGQPSFSNIDINGGDIASGVTINKSPVITLGGDLGGNVTLSSLGNGTLTATIQSSAVETSMINNLAVTGAKIANDTITDTQLEYNTGQHLTTTSDVQFGDVVVSGSDLTSGSFSSGFGGGGWKVNNASTAEFSNLILRGTLTVKELLIQQVRATNGNLFISSVGKVKSASSLSSSDDDGTITFEDPVTNLCPFVADDIIMMQQVKPGAAASGGDIIKKLVYKVSSVSNNVATVTNIGFDNQSEPEPGDEFVRIGNTSNSARKGSIYLTSDDANGPFIDIKDEVDSYADWTGTATNKVRLGKLSGITDSDINGGQALSGYGLYSNNAYLKGELAAIYDAQNQVLISPNDSSKATLTVKRANVDIFEVGSSTQAFAYNDFIVADSAPSWSGGTSDLSASTDVVYAKRLSSEDQITNNIIANRFFKVDSTDATKTNFYTKIVDHDLQATAVNATPITTVFSLNKSYVDDFSTDKYIKQSMLFDTQIDSGHADANNIRFTNSSGVGTSLYQFQAIVKDTATGDNYADGALCLMGLDVDVSGLVSADRDDFVFIQAKNGSTKKFQVQHDGDVVSAGNITAFGASGNFLNVSDIRLKKDIERLKDSSELVMQLKPSTYKWKEDNLEDVGFIAQEVEEVLPNVVHVTPGFIGDNEKVKTVSYIKIIPYLVDTIQELTKRIEELEK